MGYVDGTVPTPPHYILDQFNVHLHNPAYAMLLRIDQCIRMWLFASVSRDALLEIRNLHHSSQVGGRGASVFQ